MGTKMFVAYMVATGFLSFVNANTVLAAPQCRCLFGDPCWPLSSAFAEFQELLTHPLVYPKPTAAPCYVSSVNVSAEACLAIHTNWQNGVFRSDIPGSMEAPNWETYTFPNGTINACYVETNFTGACHQGNVPVVAVNATTPSDIQEAVKFAAEHNLRLVVKNTGHDFIGRSAGRGSLMIWTHHMKNISYNYAFIPEGSPSNDSSDAFTFAAGVQWFEAYAAAEAADRYLVGGISQGGTVGAAGGWVQGGGHSVLSPTYGLGVDNVLQMEVVIASGEHLTVNAHQNSDLFWALRGGGGGTFGVVTSVTYRAHPATPVILTSFVVNSTNPALILQTFTEHQAMLPALSDAGWGGYGAFVGTEEMYFVYLNPNISLTEANATWESFFASAASKSGLGLNVLSASSTPYSSFYTVYNGLFASGSAQNGYNVLVGSRLIPRETIETMNDALAVALFAIPGLSWNFVAGGEVNRIAPDSASVNPAWRSAIVHMTWGKTWSDGASSVEIGLLSAELKVSEAAIAALTPLSGCYFNEASPFEVDFQRTFWGTHYERLTAIKAKYDPGQLFVVHQGVGSEKWDNTLSCRV